MSEAAEASAIDVLSMDARAVLAGLFMLSDRLTYHCRESRPTKRMQAALGELVAKGFVTRDDAEYLPPAQTYYAIKGVTKEAAREVRKRHMKDGNPFKTDLPEFQVTEPVR